MKTFTKQTEEKYLETIIINDKNELVLKQEYANQIVEELRAKDLVCDCIRSNIVRRDSTYMWSNNWIDYKYGNEVV